MITIDQKRLYNWSARLTIALALLGFISSYITLWLVATDYGYNIIQATIFPLLIDAFMIVIHLVWFFLTINGVKDGWARAIMYLTVIISVVLNVSHAWGKVDYLGLVVWAIPPLTLLGSVKAMAWLVRAAMAERSGVHDEHVSLRDPIIVNAGIDTDERESEMPEHLMNGNASIDERDLTPDERDERIRTLYATEEYTVKQLGERFGVSRATASRAVNGGNGKQRSE